MDETNDETTPAGEEARAGQERGKRGCGCLGGLLSGAVVGGGLAWLLAPRSNEERARREMIEKGGWDIGEGAEEGGRPPAQMALERAEAIAWGVASRVATALKTVKERFRDAVEEGKEGIAEGQEEARARYEFMTKRRRPRR